jgi:hypothetical protein
MSRSNIDLREALAQVPEAALRELERKYGVTILGFLAPRKRYIIVRTDFPAFGERFATQEQADRRMMELEDSDAFWRNKLELLKL